MGDQCGCNTLQGVDVNPQIEVSINTAEHVVRGHVIVEVEE